MGHVFGQFAGASDLFGRQTFLPVIHVGAAIQLHGMCLSTCQFRRVFRATGIQDGLFHFAGEVQPEFGIQVTVAIDGVTRDLLVANDHDIGIPLTGRMNRAIDHLPEQASLSDDVIRLDGLHLVTIFFEVVTHQQRLIQQILEIEAPAQTFETAGERTGVTL